MTGAHSTDEQLGATMALFVSKTRKDVAKFVVCCSLDWCFKGFNYSARLALDLNFRLSLYPYNFMLAVKALVGLHLCTDWSEPLSLKDGISITGDKITLIRS